MHFPPQWYAKSSWYYRTQDLLLLEQWVEDDYFSFMLQIKELLRYFIAYQKDDGVKLLIMKVSPLR